MSFSSSRAFVGVTVHWLDEDLNRQSAVLACRRVLGRHTHQKLARDLYDIHKEFKIDSKVSLTTTDNASNYVSAFKKYFNAIPLPHSLDDAPLDNYEPDADECVLIDSDAEPEIEHDDDTMIIPTTDNDEDFELFEISDAEPFGLMPVDTDAIFVMEPSPAEERSDGEEMEEPIDNSDVTLPRHQRCAAHTLNLMGTTDTEKIMTLSRPGSSDQLPAEYRVSDVAKQAFHYSLSNLKAFWAKYNRSSQVRGVGLTLGCVCVATMMCLREQTVPCMLFMYVCVYCVCIHLRVLTRS